MLLGTRIVLFACLLTSFPDARAADLTLQDQVARGERVFLGRQQGHCLLCHQVNQLDAGFQGNLGPDLSDVGRRLSQAQIRAIIANPQAFNPDSIMPAYAQTDGRVRVARKFIGMPILNAGELEDVSAYVASLVTSGVETP